MQGPAVVVLYYVVNTYMLLNFLNIQVVIWLILVTYTTWVHIQEKHANIIKNNDSV